MRNLLLLLVAFILVSCTGQQTKETSNAVNSNDTFSAGNTLDSTVNTKVVYAPASFNGQVIKTGVTTPSELLSFAKTLSGIPYKYGSTDPLQGFDCSGFITYIFNHFNIAVPRSSVDFTNVEREIDLAEAKPGDLILYTGTDSTIRIVGHMGVITSNDNEAIEFIHSTSGKANGVTITPLNKYYMGRFVKVIRIFKQNDAA